MAATARAKKQCFCHQDEDSNFLWKLASEPRTHTVFRGTFWPIPRNLATWLKKTITIPPRGFPDGGDSVTASRRRNAQQKVRILELMLGQIANYRMIISTKTIVKNSTSIDSIWSAIHMHFRLEAHGHIQLPTYTSSTANVQQIFNKDLWPSERKASFAPTAVVTIASPSQGMRR